jgi:hypothetical protein
MDATDKEIADKFQMLQAVMMDLLDADPANGWYWITEAQRRALQAQMASVTEPERKAS